MAPAGPPAMPEVQGTHSPLSAGMLKAETTSHSYVSAGLTHTHTHTPHSCNTHTTLTLTHTHSHTHTVFALNHATADDFQPQALRDIHRMIAESFQGSKALLSGTSATKPRVIMERATPQTSTSTSLGLCASV